MGIQHKPRATLQELLEAQPGGIAPGKAPQAKLPIPPPTPALPLRLEPADLERKREPKGKEVVEVGRTTSFQEDKA